ncbi:helix-turn-helix transcriptional regulator [Natronobiforma cellulositropha]|uniref:helix-turn-helix transcriptional regulator n=1 Tax=Natronobiforma cellulositropha TaxID=1679076 RepID=UPI0021D5E64D|nr:hypothetical protein [Natronobiforma cellulositropha]
MEPRVGWALCCWIVVLVLVVGGGATATASDTPEPALVAPAFEHAVDSSAGTAQDEDDISLAGYDEIGVEIDLHGNGTANWEVEYRYRLDDGNESVDWEPLREDVEDRPEAYVEWFEADRLEMLAAAEETTEREMSLSRFAVETDDASVSPQEYGKVRFTFAWSSFAHVEVNRIEVGDALEGFVMDERMHLVVSWPEGFEDTAIEPTPDDRRETAVIWYGEQTQEFVDDEPRLDLIQTGSDGNTPQPVEEDTDDGSPPLSLLAGLGALALAGLAVAVWWYRRADGSPGPSPQPPEPRSEDAAAAADTTPETNGPPLELLSNEEHVLRLLEERGGRVKQQEVVAELEWTEAKTSQVVSGLRESGEIDVFRIGRENVLTVPDDDLDGPADSTD